MDGMGKAMEILKLWYFIGIIIGLYLFALLVPCFVNLKSYLKKRKNESVANRIKFKPSQMMKKIMEQRETSTRYTSQDERCMLQKEILSVKAMLQELVDTKPRKESIF